MLMFLAKNLCLVLAITFVSPQAADAKSKSKKKSATEEQDTWDVAKPPGTSKTIVIDTKETTWSDVDVSPDGRTVVFDMLGDIYAVPIEGGEAPGQRGFPTR